MQLKPKKKLGQNFLFDRNVQRKVVAACGFKANETVVELGCGRGELTGLIAERVKKVFALEIDPALCALAAETLKSFANIQIINTDILKFDFAKFFKRLKVKVFGNIPYYISSPIIAHLIESRSNITQAYLTVQKEFSRRMNASSGSSEYGSLSCFVQYYAETAVLFDIKKNSFFPAPKVGSSLVKLAMRRHPAVAVKDERLFFKIIRGAFNQRRKTLRNSLKGILPRDAVERFFSRHSLDPHIRPERLTLQDFANLSES